jgi:molybdopterin converting factor small subunit
MARFIPHFKLANEIGVHEIEWDVQTVRDLIDEGKRQYGSTFVDELKKATILVNGRAISYLDGYNTRLAPSDEVWSVLPSAGG